MWQCVQVMETHCIMAYPCYTERKCTITRVVTCVIARSSYGNALHYSLLIWLFLAGIVYQHTYFSIFIMISFVADSYDSRTYIECVFLWITIRQSYIISDFVYNRTTWIQAIILEQVFLKKNLNFNMYGRHPYSYCHTKHQFDIFAKVALCLAV